MKIFVDAHNIISPLGQTSEQNFDQLIKGNSGVQKHDNTSIDSEPIWASIINEQDWKSIIGTKAVTKFEALLIRSVEYALKNSSINPSADDTIFIVSTTKGNIVEIEQQAEEENLLLGTSANRLTDYFNNKNQAIVISNACISGVQAIVLAKRLLFEGFYKHAIIVGADTMSKFVYSGFKSFQALSPSRCKPFSSNREGINLGEAAATLILTTQKQSNTEVLGGAVSNDSNHISGPSRTGQELSSAINKALQGSAILASQIDFVSAHGTATPYNDEMESKAFQLSQLVNSEVNSLKGYFGHTLGAAGLVESVISILAMQHQLIPATIGFTELGVSGLARVSNQNVQKQIKYTLKTASGFGGCNAAVIFSQNTLPHP